MQTGKALSHQHISRAMSSPCRYSGRSKIPSFTATGTGKGFTYIGILIAVTIIGVGLSATGVVWHTVTQRDRERQLLFIGNQFRTAIGHYYTAAGGSAQFPVSLDDLLRDPRQPGVVRHIRKIYYDPITGSQNWGLIKNINNRIIGVYSLSQQQPIKQSNFTQSDKDFEGKMAYSEWTFIYKPGILRANTIPQTNSVAPAAPHPPTPSEQ